MPTPKGKGLSGSADGRTPGWEERTKTRVNEAQAATQKRKGRRRAANILLEFDLPFLTLLRQAAETRGMSSAGYARRAVAAFIAKDLGMDFPEVTQHFSAPHRPGEVLSPTGKRTVHMKPGGTSDDGTGHGNWQVR